MGGGSSDDRRLKAALFLLACLAAGLLPHALGPLARLLPSLSLAGLLGAYAVRTVFLRPRPDQVASGSGHIDSSGTAAADGAAPITAAAAAVLNPQNPGEEAHGHGGVDVVVAARDEEAVIGRLVERVMRLHWPTGQLRLWVIDDGSEDRTPQVLADLQSQHPGLRVLRRSRDAGGGKSAALNLVLEQLQGRWMLVLDADADLAADLLVRLIPFAEEGGWAAVQLRKAEVNADHNWLTRAQAMEMALDATIQEGRLAHGGIAELRGNGQLLRRDAVLLAGGFNEATITDDLDLSFRLLLAGLPVGVLWDPPVCEEAVLTLPALWRQRQRWAEGGLQRFFDYGDQLLSDRISRTQKIDLAAFFVLQYVLPVMAVADLLGALISGTPPGMWPFSLVALGLSGFSMLLGCRRPAEGPALPRPGPVHLSFAILYLIHWFVVIPWVTLKMALLPKSLVWAKTAHGVNATTVPDADNASPGFELDLGLDSTALDEDAVISP